MRVERVRVPWAGGTLEAEWRQGSRAGAVVAPPHPLYGGSIAHPVVQSLADVLADIGHATIAFNWRGVGTSDGSVTGDVEAALADYRAAATLLCQCQPGRWIAAGYSFGAATALRLVAAGERDAAALLLVAPPTARLGSEDLAACTRPVGVVAAEHDAFAPAAALRALLEVKERARLEILDGADHFFTGIDPARLAAAIRAAVPETT